MKGDDDDAISNHYNVRLLVGPYWQDVNSVVPKVTVDGISSTNPDEDDFMKWKVSGLTWDTLGEFGPGMNELRIRLKFNVEIQGSHFYVQRIGYWLMASGRRLGVGGINEPGPVHPQG